MIGAAHEEALAAAGTAVARAIEVGRLLAEAKSQLRHREWAGWVEAHCAFGTHQAAKYLRAYREQRQIGPGGSDFGSLR
jgi:hypothetical protein